MLSFPIQTAQAIHKIKLLPWYKSALMQLITALEALQPAHEGFCTA